MTPSQPTGESGGESLYQIPTYEVAPDMNVADLPFPNSDHDIFSRAPKTRRGDHKKRAA